MRGEEIAVKLGHGAFNQIRFINVESYPNGEPLVKVTFDLAVGVERVMLRPKSTHGLMAGLFWIDSLQERGHKVRELLLPCFFGARQDRLNSSGDQLFTAKSVAKIVNSLKIDRVTVLDPHSDVTPALLDRCRVIHPYEILTHGSLSAAPGFKFPGIGPYEAIIAPDAGAEKRAGKVAERLQIPLIHGWKKRDVATGSLTGFGLGDTSFIPDGGRVLVVDDLCDGGGTFVGLAQVLERRLSADLYVTHGLFTKGTQPLLDCYNKVFCTDSVAGDRPGVEVIPVADTILSKGFWS